MWGKEYFQNLIFILESNQVASIKININMYCNPAIPLLKDYSTEIRVLQIKICMSRIVADRQRYPLCLLTLPHHCPLVCLPTDSTHILLPEIVAGAHLATFTKYWEPTLTGSSLQPITGVNWSKYPNSLTLG